VRLSREWGWFTLDIVCERKHEGVQGHYLEWPRRNTVFLYLSFDISLWWGICADCLSHVMLGKRFEAEIWWFSNSQGILLLKRHHSGLGSEELATSDYRVLRHDWLRWRSNFVELQTITVSWIISSMQHFSVLRFKYHPPASRHLKHFCIGNIIMVQSLDGSCWYTHVIAY
jgi:hypothetical protein